MLGTGAYLVVDGISNFVEGADKLALDAGVDIMSWQEESFNPLEDLGYETVWGEEKGELYYNRASLGAGLICIGKDLYDIGDDILNSNKIHRCVRKRQTAKARRLNLETETVLEYRKYKGNKLVFTLREVNSNTATPMILERTFVEVPELVKGVGKGVGATLNDVKNTKGAFEGSAIDEKN